MSLSMMTRLANCPGVPAADLSLNTVYDAFFGFAEFSAQHDGEAPICSRDSRREYGIGRCGSRVALYLLHPLTDRRTNSLRSEEKSEHSNDLLLLVSLPGRP
jgi:hypothetical protein